MGKKAGVLLDTSLINSINRPWDQYPQGSAGSQLCCKQPTKEINFSRVSGDIMFF